MAFSTVVIVTLVIYLLYYAANIVYDLFLSNAMKPVPSDFEEEIEISETDNQLQGTFYTSVIEKEESNSILPGYEDSDILLEREAPKLELIASMNGSLDIDDLYQQVQNAQSDSDLLFVSHSWN